MADGYLNTSIFQPWRNDIIGCAGRCRSAQYRGKHVVNYQFRNGWGCITIPKGATGFELFPMIIEVPVLSCPAFDGPTFSGGLGKIRDMLIRIRYLDKIADTCSDIRLALCSIASKALSLSSGNLHNWDRYLEAILLTSRECYGEQPARFILDSDFSVLRDLIRQAEDHNLQILLSVGKIFSLACQQKRTASRDDIQSALCVLDTLEKELPSWDTRIAPQD